MNCEENTEPKTRYQPLQTSGNQLTTSTHIVTLASTKTQTSYVLYKFCLLTFLSHPKHKEEMQMAQSFD